MVFEDSYQEPCKKAIYATVVQSDLRDSLLLAIKKRLQEDFQHLERETMRSRRAFHSEKLEELFPYLSDLKTHKTCLACLLRSPEKVLTCGHALCDVCVQYFGSRCSEARDVYRLDDCVLCGTNNERTPLQILPPTAGIRVLSLDGGGVRGIVPLVLLRKLESHLDGFQLPIRDFFDFVCGTSAGTLVCCPGRNAC